MDGLTADQLKELHADLVALRSSLDAVISGMQDGSKPVELDTAIGRVTRMDAIQQQQMTRANRATASRRLQQVTAALLRLDADAYGECVECGDDIGYPRLKARPEATFCLDCQSSRESR